MKMIKQHLFTPGPTHIPPQVFAAMAQPTLHHRTEAFERIFDSAIKSYSALVGGEHETIFLASSGSGAMEAALVNAIKPGEKIIYINAGKFGERWGDICQALSIEAIQIFAEAGQSPELSIIAEVVKNNLDARAFCVQYTESSTALLHPVPEISRLVHELAPEMLIMVDAISALATLDIPLAKLPIDILIGASQKALMLPPGLSMLSISARAWKVIESIPRRSLYFDLPLERKVHKKSTSAWTPAMNIILGLDCSLKMLQEEGLTQTFKRHAIAAEVARAGLTSLNLKLLSEHYPAPGVTAAILPSSIDAEKVRDKLVAHFAIQIAGGQDELKGKIIRIGHMGYMTAFDVITALSALEIVLKGFGHQFVTGSSLIAAQQVLERHGGIV
jgi:serine---pyruvate transaminase